MSCGVLKERILARECIISPRRESDGGERERTVYVQDDKEEEISRWNEGYTWNVVVENGNMYSAHHGADEM